MKTAVLSNSTSKSIYPSIQQNNSLISQQLRDKFKRKRNEVHIQEVYQIRSVKQNVQQKDLEKLMNNYQRKYGKLEEELVRSSVGVKQDKMIKNYQMNMPSRNIRSSLNINQYVISQTPKKQSKNQPPLYQQKPKQPLKFQTQLKSLIKIIYQKQKQIQKYKYYSNEQRIKRQKLQNQRKIKEENNLEVQSCRMINNLSEELIQTTTKVGQLQDKLMELHGIVEFLIKERDQFRAKNSQLQMQIRTNNKLQQKKSANRARHYQTQTQSNISLLQLKLQQLNFQITQLRSFNNQLTTKTTKLQNQKILLSKQVNTLQQQVFTKSFELKQIVLKNENEIKSKNNLSIEIKSNIQQYKIKIFQLEKLNLKANQQVIFVRKLIQEKQISNINLGNQNYRLNNNIQLLNCQITKNTHNIQSLTNQIKLEKSKLRNIQHKLQKQKQSIIYKQQQIQIQHKILSQRQQKIKIKYQQLTQKQQKLKQKQQQLKQQQQRLKLQQQRLKQNEQNLKQKQSQLNEKQCQLNEKQCQLNEKQCQLNEKQCQQPHPFQSNHLLSLPTICNLSYIQLLNSSFQQKLHKINQQPTSQSPSFLQYQTNLLNQLQKQCQQPTQIFLQKPIDNTKMVELDQVRQSLKMTKEVNFQLFQEINKMEKFITNYQLTIKDFFTQFYNFKTGKGNDQILKIHKVRSQLDKMEKLIQSNFR